MQNQEKVATNTDANLEAEGTEVEVKNPRTQILEGHRVDRKEEVERQSTLLQEGGEAEAETQVESHKVKVNGSESDVKTSDINKYLGNDEDTILSRKDVIEYQKGLAADAKFNQIDKMAKDLERREAEFDEKLKTATAPPPKEAPKRKLRLKPQETKTDFDTLATQLQDAVLTEDKDKTAKILQQITQSQKQTPGVTPEQMKAEIEKVVAGMPAKVASINAADRNKKLQRDAENYFVGKYPALVDSPLRNEIDRVSVELYATDPTNPVNDTIDAAVLQVKEAAAAELGFSADQVDQPPRKAPTGGAPRPTQARANINREPPPPLTKQQSLARTIEKRNSRLSI